jgi:putative ABC transport system ATP-binding protein
LDKPETILRLEGVRFRWPGRNSFEISVPDFHMRRGETVLLLGASGSGKSTLLSLICGTVLPQEGIVEVAGTNVCKLRGGMRDRFRAEQIGIIFQQFNLLPFGTVEDNIVLPLSFAPERRSKAGNARETAASLAGNLGLAEQLLSARASTLSVGQQQRVAVARALIGRPPIIIADEPTSSLDAGSQSRFLDLLFDQVTTNDATLLMVSHDPRLADRFDKTIMMTDIATIERQPQ